MVAETREKEATSSPIRNTEEEEEQSAAEENTTVLESPAHYNLSDSVSKLEDSGCKVSLGTQLFAIESIAGQRHEFGYREITGIKPLDYEVIVSLRGSSFSLTQLGEKYDDFVRLVFVLRNDQLAHDLLVDEGKPSLSVRGDLEITKGTDSSKSDGEVRIYKTRLGVFPNEGETFIARLAEISGFIYEDYIASFSVDGRKVAIRDLGEHFDQFTRAFQATNAELLKETTTLLREVCPTISFTSLSRLSRLMLDGKAIRFKDAIALAPDFAKSFQVQLEAGDDEMLKSMQYLLVDIGDAENSLIGVKKLVSDYLYMLIPVKGHDIVGLESNEKGHATYFFKSKLEEVAQIVEGLRDVNFRRQPIYLTDNDFLKPQYSRYNFALQKLDTLRKLRERFIGRAIHSDFETWKSQTEALVSGK